LREICIELYYSFMKQQPQQPFPASGNWYKGALHIHTQLSDGYVTPTKAIDLYHAKNFNFICFTDHEGITELASPHPNCLTINGIENAMESSFPTRHFHFVGINVKPLPRETPFPWIKNPDGIEADYIYMPLGSNHRSPNKVAKLLSKMSGFLILAHPYWSNLANNNVKKLSKFCDALEVYNTGADFSIGRGYSEYVWDEALSDGAYINAVAADDTHDYETTCGLAWVMVKSPELTVEGIMDALKCGRYYSSTGPEIKDFRIDGQRIIAETSPCTRIDLISNTYLGSSYHADLNDQKTVTEAEFELSPDMQYIRLQCYDLAGKKAWSNPIYLTPDRKRFRMRSFQLQK